MHDGRVSFQGHVTKRSEVLLAPASGLPCVHWRLKITEPIDARLQLVHEVASAEGFDVTWADGADAPELQRLCLRLPATPRAAIGPVASSAHAEDAVRIRVVSESLQLRAAPVLHRPGSPGALRVARQFGLSNAISVEEIALPEGERVQVAGVLDGGAAGGVGHRGPFREVASALELHEGDLVVASRRELGPALLPWALGTAAAILAGVGATAWAAWRFDVLGGFDNTAPAHLQPAPAEIGPPTYSRTHFSRPD
jgi:hypothetical protein